MKTMKILLAALTLAAVQNIHAAPTCDNQGYCRCDAGDSLDACRRTVVLGDGPWLWSSSITGNQQWQFQFAGNNVVLLSIDGQPSNYYVPYVLEASYTPAGSGAAVFNRSFMKVQVESQIFSLEWSDRTGVVKRQVCMEDPAVGPRRYCYYY